MALSVITPTYAFTNQFPALTVQGTAKSKLLVSVTLSGSSVLDGEILYFDSDGLAVIRGLGDLLEKYFYDQNYDIRTFSKSLVLTLNSSGETVTKTIPVYFCRSYVSGDQLTPDLVRSMPLTRSVLKYTLPSVQEYLSFISTAGLKVCCDILYLSGGKIGTSTIDLYTFANTDYYCTIDVSVSSIIAKIPAGQSIIHYDIYLQGHKEKNVRYEVDKSMSFDPTVFIYQNDFGGVESFLCRGIRKDELTSERETAVLNGRSYLAKQTSLRSFTVNTGYLSTSQHESLISLLSSYSLMVIKDNIAIPVMISGENLSLHNFRSVLPTADFTYNYSARNLTIYKYYRDKGIFDSTFDQTFN